MEFPGQESAAFGAPPPNGFVEETFHNDDSSASASFFDQGSNDTSSPVRNDEWDPMAQRSFPATTNNESPDTSSVQHHKNSSGSPLIYHPTMDNKLFRNVAVQKKKHNSPIFKGRTAAESSILATTPPQADHRIEDEGAAPSINHSPPPAAWNMAAASGAASSPMNIGQDTSSLFPSPAHTPRTRNIIKTISQEFDNAPMEVSELENHKNVPPPIVPPPVLDNRGTPEEPAAVFVGPSTPVGPPPVPFAAQQVRKELDMSSHHDNGLSSSQLSNISDHSTPPFFRSSANNSITGSLNLSGLEGSLNVVTKYLGGIRSQESIKRAELEQRKIEQQKSSEDLRQLKELFNALKKEKDVFKKEREIIKKEQEEALKKEQEVFKMEREMLKKEQEDALRKEQEIFMREREMLKKEQEALVNKVVSLENQVKQFSAEKKKAAAAVSSLPVPAIVPEKVFQPNFEAPAAVAPEAPVVNATAPINSDPATISQNEFIVKQLHQFYSCHSPDKLDNIPNLMQEFGSRPDDLIVALESKYSVEVVKETKIAFNQFMKGADVDEASLKASVDNAILLSDDAPVTPKKSAPPRTKRETAHFILKKQDGPQTPQQPFVMSSDMFIPNADRPEDPISPTMPPLSQSFAMGLASEAMSRVPNSPPPLELDDKHFDDNNFSAPFQHVPAPVNAFYPIQDTVNVTTQDDKDTSDLAKTLEKNEAFRRSSSDASASIDSGSFMPPRPPSPTSKRKKKRGKKKSIDIPPAPSHPPPPLEDETNLPSVEQSVVAPPPVNETPVNEGPIPEFSDPEPSPPKDESKTDHGPPKDLGAPLPPSENNGPPPPMGATGAPPMGNTSSGPPNPSTEGPPPAAAVGVGGGPPMGNQFRRRTSKAVHRGSTGPPPNVHVFRPHNPEAEATMDAPIPPVAQAENVNPTNEETNQKENTTEATNLPSLSNLLTEFYSKHQPDKVGNVENIVAQYTGDEKSLVEGLRAKYGRAPVQDLLKALPELERIGKEKLQQRRQNNVAAKGRGCCSCFGLFSFLIALPIIYFAASVMVSVFFCPPLSNLSSCEPGATVDFDCYCWNYQLHAQDVSLDPGLDNVLQVVSNLPAAVPLVINDKFDTDVAEVSLEAYNVAESTVQSAWEVSEPYVKDGISSLSTFVENVPDYLSTIYEDLSSSSTTTSSEEEQDKDDEYLVEEDYEEPTESPETEEGVDEERYNDDDETPIEVEVDPLGELNDRDNEPDAVVDDEAPHASEENRKDPVVSNEEEVRVTEAPQEVEVLPQGSIGKQVDGILESDVLFSNVNETEDTLETTEDNKEINTEEQMIRETDEEQVLPEVVVETEEIANEEIEAHVVQNDIDSDDEEAAAVQEVDAETIKDEDQEYKGLSNSDNVPDDNDDSLNTLQMEGEVTEEPEATVIEDAKFDEDEIFLEDAVVTADTKVEEEIALSNDGLDEKKVEAVDSDFGDKTAEDTSSIEEEEEVVEEPVAEELVVEEAVVEEPVVEEAIVEEAVTEEPAMEDPVESANPTETSASEDESIDKVSLEANDDLAATEEVPAKDATAEIPEEVLAEASEEVGVILDVTKDSSNTDSTLLEKDQVLAEEPVFIEKKSEDKGAKVVQDYADVEKEVSPLDADGFNKFLPFGDELKEQFVQAEKVVLQEMEES